MPTVGCGPLLVRSVFEIFVGQQLFRGGIVKAVFR
jgi:hypothetical protein